MSKAAARSRLSPLSLSLSPLTFSRLLASSSQLPVAWTSDVSLNPLEAQYQLPPAVFYQLAISIFIAEGLRAQIIFNGDRIPGDHGFDPFGWAPKDPAALQVMKTKEVRDRHARPVAPSSPLPASPLTPLPLSPLPRSSTAGWR